MSEPKFSSDIAYVPVNFQDKDNLVGRLMEVIEAVMPEGTQQNATKSLLKQRLSEYFVHLYNDAFTSLTNRSNTIDGIWDRYVKAMWEAQEKLDIKPAR